MPSAWDVRNQDFEGSIGTHKDKNLGFDHETWQQRSGEG